LFIQITGNFLILFKNEFIFIANNYTEKILMSSDNDIKWLHQEIMLDFKDEKLILMSSCMTTYN